MVAGMSGAIDQAKQPLAARTPAGQESLSRDISRCRDMSRVMRCSPSAVVFDWAVVPPNGKLCGHSAEGRTSGTETSLGRPRPERGCCALRSSSVVGRQPKPRQVSATEVDTDGT